MANRPYVCGYDFGTLSCRITVSDRSTGETVYEAGVDYPHGVISQQLPESDVVLGLDWALQDPEDYLEVMTQLTRMALEKVAPEEIAAIGTDFTNCTVVALGADGRPLCMQENFRQTPHAWPKLWKHHAAQPYAKRIEEILTAENVDWFPLYGRNVSSEWLFPKVLQVYEEAPEVYAAAGTFLEAADYIPYWLTGNLVRNSATLGVNAFYEEGRGFPQKELLEKFSPGFSGVLDKLTGPVKPVGSRAGTLTPQAAERLGLLPDTVVAVGHGDSEIAAAGLGVTESGSMLMVMGTSTCYQMMHRNKIAFDGVCAIVRDGMIPGLVAYESGQPAVGDTFAWFADNMLPQQYQKAAADEGMSVLAYMDRLCGQLKAGESGLVALDWFNGNRSVLMNYGLRGVIAGLSLASRPEEIYRSLIEATAFGARRIFDSYTQAGVGIEKVYAAGGLARKSPVTMQIYADILNRPITATSISNSSSLGAAVCAAVALEEETGTYEAFRRVCGRMIHYDAAVYRPDPKAAATYEKLYQVYLELHDFVGKQASMCEALNAIQTAAKAVE